MPYKISPWNTFPSSSWEVVRRVESYKKLYAKTAPIDLLAAQLSDDAVQLTALKLYPEFEKYGLLFPANPELSAVDANVFWHPDHFSSAVRFHVLEVASVRPEARPIKLSDYPAKRSYFKGADGSYHARFLGAGFWFQLHCDDLDLGSEDVYIGLEFNHAKGREKRLKTAALIFGILDGSLPARTNIHTPKRADLHRSAALVYDIRSSGGSWKDAIEAHFGKKYLIKNPDKFEYARTIVRNHYLRAESQLRGQFLKILNQTR